MARTYKRDARGRFSGGGGFSGSGGRTSKKNRSAAQALYKQTSGQVRRESNNSNMSSRERSVAKRRLKSLVDRRGVDGRKEGAKKAAATRRKKVEAKTRAATGAANRKANTARAAELRGKGVTGMGSRLKAKGFAGGKAAQKRAGGLRVSGAAARIQGSSQAFSVGRRFNQTASRSAATKKAVRKARTEVSKAGQRGKSLARTNKKAPNPAQARYKELSTRVRSGKRFAGAGDIFTNKGWGTKSDAASARRSKRAMERRRR